MKHKILKTLTAIALISVAYPVSADSLFMEEEGDFLDNNAVKIAADTREGSYTTASTANNTQGNAQGEPNTNSSNNSDASTYWRSNYD